MPFAAPTIRVHRSHLTPFPSLLFETHNAVQRPTEEHIGTLIDADALDRSPLDGDGVASDGTPEDNGDDDEHKVLSPIIEVKTPIDTPGTATKGSVAVPASGFPVPPLPTSRVARDPTDRLGPSDAGAARTDEENQGDDEPMGHDAAAVGKTDEELAAEAPSRRNKRLMMSLAAMLLLLAVVLGSVFGTRSAASKKGEPNRSVVPGGPTLSPSRTAETGEDAPAGPTRAPTPFVLEDLYEEPHPGECRDASGRTYGEIRINLDQVEDAGRTAEDCGRVCGTMPRPDGQVGFQYGPTEGYGFNCRCLYEAGAVASIAEVPGDWDWPRDAGGGGEGRPAPEPVLFSDGMLCYAARTPSEAPSGSPSVLIDWGWIPRPPPATASPLPEGVSHFLLFGPETSLVCGARPRPRCSCPHPCLNSNPSLR